MTMLTCNNIVNVKCTFMNGVECRQGLLVAEKHWPGNSTTQVPLYYRIGRCYSICVIKIRETCYTTQMVYESLQISYTSLHKHISVRWQKCKIKRGIKNEAAENNPYKKQIKTTKNSHNKLYNNTPIIFLVFFFATITS